MTITTRAAKGSALTHTELDTNFTELAAAVAFLTPTDTAYAAAVPLTGTLYMPQTSVTSAIAFTVVAGPLKGANTYLRLVANGTNTPTFSGMREWGGSSGFDNRNGIVNEIQFFNDGVDSWYSISQEVNAQALPAPATAVSMTGPTTGVSGVASTAFSIGVTPLGGAITGTVVVTPSDAAAGGTFTPTSVNLTTAAPAATFTYTPSSAGAKTISVTNNGGLTNPANITYTASAAATAPAQVTGLTLGAATTTTQPLSWTAPSNGGSAITDYVVQHSPAGAGTWTTFADGTSTATSATVTGLTASTSYDYRVAAVNAVGTGTNSTTATGSTAAAVTAPGAPTIGAATGGDTSASVTFTAPASDGGSAITGYTVTSSPGGLTATGASSPLTVTGLTNGTAYTFSVTATNAIGTSAASAASNSVTPAAAAITYATLSPTDKSPNISLSGGNLTATSNVAGWKSVKSTISKTSGKWYFEVQFTNTFQRIIGYGTAATLVSNFAGASADSGGYYSQTGAKYNNGGQTAYGAAFVAGDVVGVALDIDAGTITMYKNGVSQGVMYSTLGGGTIFAMLSLNDTLQSVTANFGATAFVHSVPAGFNAGLYA